MEEESHLVGLGLADVHAGVVLHELHHPLLPVELELARLVGGHGLAVAGRLGLGLRVGGFHHPVPPQQHVVHIAELPEHMVLICGGQLLPELSLLHIPQHLAYDRVVPGVASQYR